MRILFFFLFSFVLAHEPVAAEKKGAKVLSFQESVKDEKVLPEGCGNPYAEAIRFRDFYDNTLAFIAARRGAHAKGVVDLFAVSAVRDEIASVFPNYTEESPIDRLIMAQLCQFQKISAQTLVPGDKPLLITASSSPLHDHLILVSAKMYADAKALLLEALADQKKKEQENASLKLRYSEILKAREQSRKRVGDLVN